MPKLGAFVSVFCWMALTSLSSADVVQPYADLVDTLRNTSCFLGGTTNFTCQVEGTVSVGDVLRFAKVDKDTGKQVLLSEDSVAVDIDKHFITGRYTLQIRNVTWGDEGEYQCVLGVKDPKVAHLMVVDPPTNVSLYWSGDKDWTVLDVPANLTCETSPSRPLPTIRWFRETTEVTGIAINPDSNIDSQGYGSGSSILALQPMEREESITYRCYVDVPNERAILTKQITIAFSGGEKVQGVIFLVLFLLCLHLA